MFTSIFKYNKMINIQELNDFQKFKLEQVEKDYKISYENYHLNKYKEIAKLLLLPDNYFKTVVETLLNTKIEDSSLYIYKDYLVEFGYLPTDKNLKYYFGKRMVKGDLIYNINYFYFLQKPKYFATIEFENLESCDDTCIGETLEKHLGGEHFKDGSVFSATVDQIPAAMMRYNKLKESRTDLVEQVNININRHFGCIEVPIWSDLGLWASRFFDEYNEIPCFCESEERELQYAVKPYNLDKDLDSQIQADLDKLSKFNEVLNKF